MKTLNKYSQEGRAFDVLALLEEGPKTAQECCAVLDLTPNQFRSSISYLRDEICDKLDVAIPHPVPDDKYRYHVTGQWLSDDGQPAIEAGTDFAIAIVEARLHRILKDVNIALRNMPDRTVPRIKASYLNKHLTRILTVLTTIGGEDEGQGGTQGSAKAS